MHPGARRVWNLVCLSLRKKRLLRRWVCGAEILRQEGGEVQAFHAEGVDVWI